MSAIITRKSSTPTLPRITPPATPVARSISVTGGSYGPYPPPHLSTTWDHMRVPQRVNPLRPQPPKKRINSSWETMNQHWHNEKRSTLMQQREHNRYHSAWAKAFYGTPADQEAYRAHFRQVLKQQMADQDRLKAETLKNKVRESEAAVEYDNLCRSQDLEAVAKKQSFMRQYRDDNKVYMEDKWKEKKVARFQENRYDRELLRFNPINWSMTLK